jgi:hypothetical protein
MRIVHDFFGDADVVIIGSGAAELAAAQTLRDRQLAVLILEARDRVGGCALTRRLDGGIALMSGASGCTPRIVTLFCKSADPWASRSCLRSRIGPSRALISTSPSWTSDSSGWLRKLFTIARSGQPQVLWTHPPPIGWSLATADRHRQQLFQWRRTFSSVRPRHRRIS